MKVVVDWPLAVQLGQWGCGPGLPSLLSGSVLKLEFLRGGEFGSRSRFGFWLSSSTSGGCGTGLLGLVWLVRLFERWEVLEFVVAWPDAAVESGEVLKFWSS